MTNPEVSKYMASIGSKGGKANTSKAQSNRAKTYWQSLTPSERSRVMRERCRTREINRLAVKKKKRPPRAKKS